MASACVALAIDAASLEAKKAEDDRTGRDDGPLSRIHLAEVANQVTPGVKKPSVERKFGKECDEQHGEPG